MVQVCYYYQLLFVQNCCKNMKISILLSYQTYPNLAGNPYKEKVRHLFNFLFLF